MLIRHLKNTILWLSLLLTTITIDTHAQQLPLFAQHPEYHGHINPASLNIDYLVDGRNLSFGASMRQQWVQLGELSPSTQVLRGEYINDDYNIITGGYLMRDKVGITYNAMAQGRFAYVLKTGSSLEEGGISLGLNLGLANWFLKTDRLSLNQIDDPDLLQRPSSWYPDLGIGVFWYQQIGGASSHYFYMGLSAPRTFDFRSDQQGAKRLPHYYGLLGYYHPLGFSENGFFEASMWSRYVANLPIQTSFHLKIQPIPQFMLGIGAVADFKSRPLMVVEAGINIPSYAKNSIIRLGYSYTYGSFISHFGATHEINLAFTLDTR